MQPQDRKTTMFYPRQIAIGLGQRDSGALDRAVAVALELYAAGVWDGRGLLVVNFPGSVYHQLLQSPVEEYNRQYLTPIHTDVRRLRRGQDFDVHPLTAGECRRMGIGEECALSPSSGD